MVRKSWLLIAVALILVTCLTGAAQTKELKVAIGLSLPPYVISDNNSGYELDLVREALAKAGRTIKPVYMDFGQVPDALASGRVEAAMTINEASGIKGVYYSMPCVTYHDVVLALQESRLSIKTMQDLARNSIVGFQDATKYLGPEYAEAVAQNPDYREVADQAAQVAMLYEKKALMLVCDLNIFNYYRTRLESVDTSAPVVVVELFSPVDYKVGFKDAALRDGFNQALQELKAVGRDRTLRDKYLKQ